MSNIRYLKTPVGNTYTAFFSSIYGSFVDKALYGTKYVLRGFKKNRYKEMCCEWQKICLYGKYGDDIKYITDNPPFI